MNERIKQLAEQAGFVLVRDEYLFAEMMGKFAELIVKECAGLARGYMQRVHRNDGRDLGVHIKKHFGVEE